MKNTSESVDYKAKRAEDRVGNSGPSADCKEGYTFTEKDHNAIYDAIVGVGIDPRSLAFELITRRVVNKINSFDEQQ